MWSYKFVSNVRCRTSVSPCVIHKKVDFCLTYLFSSRRSATKSLRFPILAILLFFSQRFLSLAPWENTCRVSCWFVHYQYTSSTFARFFKDYKRWWFLIPFHFGRSAFGILFWSFHCWEMATITNTSLSKFQHYKRSSSQCFIHNIFHVVLAGIRETCVHRTPLKNWIITHLFFLACST